MSKKSKKKSTGGSTSPERPSAGGLSPVGLLTQEGVKASVRVVRNLHVGEIPTQLVDTIRDPQTKVVIFELTGAPSYLEGLLNQLSELPVSTNTASLEDDLRTLVGQHAEPTYLISLFRAIAMSHKRIMIIDEPPRAVGPSRFEEMQQQSQREEVVLRHSFETSLDEVVQLIMRNFSAYGEDDNRRESGMATTLAERIEEVAEALDPSDKTNRQDIVFVIGGLHKRFADIVRSHCNRGRLFYGATFEENSDTGGTISELEMGPHEMLTMLAKAHQIRPLKPEHRVLLLQDFIWRHVYTLTNPFVVPEFKEHDLPNPLNIHPPFTREAAGIYFRLIANFVFSLTEQDIAQLLEQTQVRTFAEVLSSTIADRILPLARRDSEDPYTSLRENYVQLQGMNVA